MTRMQDESELESPQIIRSKEMVSRSKRRITGIDKPAAKAYPDKAKKAGKVADIALCLYGEPTLSLSQMRTALARQLHGTSLTDAVIHDREAGR